MPDVEKNKTAENSSRFVHLHTHTHYSLLDGLSKIDDLIDLAVKDKMPALAITDHGNLYGAINFYKKCTDAGIKPIIGVEAYISDRTRFDKEPNIDNKRCHLILLAKNLTGYKNLLKLVTKSHLEGYYYKPRIDKELLRKHHDGLICLSGCFGSELSRALRANNKEKAIAIAEEHREIFGKENYYFEIMHHPGIEGHEKVRQKIINLSRELDIPLVGTQDSHYAHPEDKKAHETLLAVQTGVGKGEQKFTFGKEDFSFIDSETAKKYFSETPEAVSNTLRIADSCDLSLELGSWVFPNFEVPQGTTHDKELRRLAYEGIKKRGLTQTKEITDRIEHELSVISDKGYSPYFLVVADLIRFAHENAILTNTRGSAAGSMVSFLTEITSVDPIKLQLPFERFLNPERPSPPDVDMDFADNRRDEVIRYAREKYGDEHVAQIGTFGTMLARGAVRDVARALGHPYDTGDKLSRLIPMGSQGFPMTIDRALELTPELRELYKKDKTAEEIINLAKKLEGCVRHVSVHAAGVVISPTALVDYTPLQHDPKGGKVITQYDMYTVEEAGLLKFDFLGIRNLSILGDAVRLVKKHHDKDIYLGNIPLDDKKTFEMLTRGETMGLFQLNGSGMTRYLKEMKPTKIEDLSVMVALYRPGPMSNIDEYIARKHGKKEITFMHPKMRKFLAPTYGVLVYQDDLLMTALEVAGYTWGEVDKFRKAVGKKIPKEMARQHKIFVEGCKKHGGMDDKSAESLWDLFEPFQGYGFNKCVTGDTQLRRKRIDTDLTHMYENISIIDVCPGDEVASLDEELGRIVWSKVNKLMSMGEEPIYKLSTTSGKTIRTTGTHPYLVLTPGNRSVRHNSTLENAAWLTTSKLFPGDYIASARPRAGVFIDDANMFYAQRKAGWRVDFKKLKCFLETFFEVQHMNYYITIPNKKDIVYKKTSAHIEQLEKRYGDTLTVKTKPLKYIFDKETKTSKKKGNVDGMIAVDLLAYADDLDVIIILSGDSDYVDIVPPLLKHGKKVLFMGFESNMAWELRQRQHVYFDKIKDFVDSNNKNAPDFGSGVPLLTKLYSHMEILSSNHVDNGIAEFVWEKIDSLEKVQTEPVYDLEIESTHNFVANGIIAHNSHAASYGHLAYQTAYMKANYPSEYMAAVLTADSGDVEKIAETISECVRMNIPVLPPDINESFGDFTVMKDPDGDKIRFGLYSIKNFGEEIANAIIGEREQGGKFTSYGDVLERVHHKNLNKKSLEALVQCGAMDFFGERGQLYENIENALAYNKENINATSKQGSLFGLMENKDSIPKFTLRETNPLSKEQQLKWEKELLGLYISGHPLQKHRERLEKTCTPIKKIKKYPEGLQVLAGGIIDEARIITTSKGDRMAFVKITDLTDTIESVVFPRTLKEYQNFIEPESTIIFRGRISHRNSVPSIIIDKIKSL